MIKLDKEQKMFVILLILLILSIGLLIYVRSSFGQDFVL